jgi:hypothetical protein
VKLDHEEATRVIREQLEQFGFDHELVIELETVDRLVPERGNKFKRFVSKLAKPPKPESGT